MVHRIRPHLTAANIMSALALFIALGGTSYAAITITGANVRDNSLTGRDVRNGSLGTADLAATARRALRGQRGPQGTSGATGERGSDGAAGATGPAGATGAQGVAGPKGDPGERGEDGIDWQGAWSASTLYTPGDGVTVDGSSYRAIAISMNQQPPSATYWQVIAARGADGADGQDGDTGPQGEQGLIGPQGIAGPVEVIVKPPGTSPLVEVGGTTVGSITLPIGEHALTATVTVLGSVSGADRSMEVTCHFESADLTFGTSPTATLDNLDGLSAKDELTLLGAVELDAPGQVDVKCSRSATGGANASVAFLATRASSVTQQ